MTGVRQVLELLRACDYMGVSKAHAVTDLVGCGYSEIHAKQLVRGYCLNHKPFNWRDK
jgi:hypothetical protein